MTSTTDLIIDCDPGIDDALALWLAAARTDRLRLLAVTTVAGNRPVDITTANTLRLLGAAGLDHVPVYAGAAHPLDGEPARCNLVHGADGLGGVTLPLDRAPQPMPAWRYLVDVINQRPAQSLTIAAIGPLTNLALAEQHRPGVLRRLRSLAVMGSAVTCPGNVTPLAEFNFYADPHAAQVVLEATGPSLHLFGLDVTRQVVMDSSWLASLSKLRGKCANAAQMMLEAYASQDPLLHDACPIAWVLHPELFISEPWQLRVQTLPGESAGQVSGERIAAKEWTRGHQVAIGVDVKAVLSLVRDALQRLP